MRATDRYANTLDSIDEWLERVERGLNRVPLLRAFLIRVLICRLGITSLPLLLLLTLLAAVVAALLAVGAVGASLQWLWGVAQML
ncbi:MAG: hypothetical protein IJ570_05045 [Prevotella sp.]|nr:hypothetical protein [Prevotella sp.]